LNAGGETSSVQEEDDLSIVFVQDAFHGLDEWLREATALDIDPIDTKVDGTNFGHWSVEDSSWE
jgi:hypothetical protein